MQMLWLFAIGLLQAVPLGLCVRQSSVRVSTIRANGRAEIEEMSATVVHSATQAQMSSMIGAMLRTKRMKIRDIIHVGNEKISMDDAVKHLEGNLPGEVASLIKLSKSNEQQPFSEASMQKARRILNRMIQDAWVELDDLLFESKEFEERNRGTYEQVVNDLARLGSQLASLGEKRVGAASGITAYDAERTSLEQVLEKTTQNFKSTRYKNQMELTRRKNDLAVFDFILNLTKCKPGQAFVQQSAGGLSFIQHEGEDPENFKVCKTNEGVELNFNDPELQHQVERMMTPDAQMALRAALGQSPQVSLLQMQDTMVNTTSSNMAAQVVEVVEAPHPGGQWKKCVDGQENCGLLHDLMSLEWGKFRDQVDSLTAEMTENQQAYDKEVRNFNQQFGVISDKKTQYMEVLADAISSINADTEEMNEKDEQKRDLADEFDKTMTEYRDKISEILFTRICAVRRVRNGLLIHSNTSPPPAITDCDVSDWESKTGDCYHPNGAVITCDDACPKPDPYLCGGKEMMKRDIIVVPNTYGIVCPALERLKRCGQKKCEVNCHMSTWSGWAKCSKDCEGGVQVKTRSIMTKPKNGGTGCDAVQEERSCNTGSCDRDCTLDPWSDWDFCSMACGGGFTTRTRSVLVPIRGQGKCPKPKSRRRLELKQCNEQACIGDEICIARQDLIIALDASGSVKEDGFDILRNFSMNLTQRYKERYFGYGAVKLGVVLFGNGHLVALPDGTTTISSAINLQPLTVDFALVRTALASATWQRGFTNMAQAFSTADVMLQQGGREDAQSAVLVLSDGKYSMKFQTFEKARELKDKNVKIFMAPVTEFSGKDIRPLKRLASTPWRTNFERVPGLEALKHNAEIFVQKFIAKFCPDSMSPSHLRTIEMQENYMLIHENGWPSDHCGQWFWEGSKNNKDECAETARSRGLSAFSFGRGYAVGRCYSEAITITEEFWDTYSVDRKDPPCPNGNWLYNPFFDTYAINPRTQTQTA